MSDTCSLVYFWYTLYVYIALHNPSTMHIASKSEMFLTTLSNEGAFSSNIDPLPQISPNKSFTEDQLNRLAVTATVEYIVEKLVLMNCHTMPFVYYYNLTN